MAIHFIRQFSDSPLGEEKEKTTEDKSKEVRWWALELLGLASLRRIPKWESFDELHVSTEYNHIYHIVIPWQWSVHLIVSCSPKNGRHVFSHPVFAK